MSELPPEIVKYGHLLYLVRSETDPTKQYLCDLLVPQCQCNDWQMKDSETKTKGYYCKHLDKCLPELALEFLEEIRKKTRPACTI